jgi:transporter family-2 protein
MMGWFSQAFMFGVILFIAGAGIPLMAALNSGLGVRLGNPIPAVFVLFFVALAITAALTLTNPLPSKAEIVAIPVPYYLGGVFVAFYVLSITWIAPKIGLGNAIFIVLFGQLVAAAITDHFGLLNVPKAPITIARIVGIGLMVIGICLAKKPTMDI